MQWHQSYIKIVSYWLRGVLFMWLRNKNPKLIYFIFIITLGVFVLPSIQIQVYIIVSLRWNCNKHSDWSLFFKFNVDSAHKRSKRELKKKTQFSLELNQLDIKQIYNLYNSVIMFIMLKERGSLCVAPLACKYIPGSHNT